ncbi:MAG: DUF1549 domain-containing protein [Planctomycetota bacterium]|nr:DUF1549 domain-containing protein [Planctomycetota bacterium]
MIHSPQFRCVIALTLMLLATAARPTTIVADSQVSFRLEVIPLLTKHGCATGACHGAPSGKGGFRLSLRGFDPALDRTTLIREQFGRRTNPARPELSLLLLKPTMEVAHGGGRRLRITDQSFQILETWIAQGCRPDPSDSPTCLEIGVAITDADLAQTLGGARIAKPSVTLRWPQHEQTLQVWGRFSDGSIRVITHLADFSSSHEDVATVNQLGVVTCEHRGESSILVRYLDRIATVPITQLRDVAGFAWKDAPARNFIDEMVYSKLQRLQIAPSELATDSEFLRRVSLDTLGVLPTVDESQQFLKAAQQVGVAGRFVLRDTLIDRLLERPEYAEFQAQQWADLLRVKSSKLGEAGVHKFHQWLVASVNDNLPYDQFVRELLAGRGSTFESPSAAFFQAATDPNSLAETTSQLFLGIRVQCARCHNHPFERWTQDHYYGMAAFFSRVRIKDGFAADEKIVWQASDGEVTHPRSNQPAALIVPLTGELAVKPDQGRLEALSEWLTSASNPFFARMAVNRLWARCFGRGIVEPVDDFRESNPPSHPELLDRLAREFIAGGYNTKHIMRLILQSRVYQLSSLTNRFNVDDERYFSHAHARLLRAEQLLDALNQVAGVPERFSGLPLGTRATQLPSPDVGNDFLKTFGQPSRNTACECERNGEPKLTQALNLINGSALSGKLTDTRSRLSQHLDDSSTRVARAGLPPTKQLKLWLRADRGVEAADGGLAIDGSAVTHWRNQVLGSTVHVSQLDPDSRPVFVARAIGGSPAVRFDGRNDWLHNATSNLLEAGQARTVLAVGRSGDQGGSLITFRRGRPVFTAQLGLHSGTFYVYSDGVNGAGNSALSADAAKLTSQPFVTTFISTGIGEKLQVRLNGTPQSITQAGGVGSDSGAAGFTIGAREDYEGFRWDGDIAEVLVYDGVLASPDLEQAGSYLATKYGVRTAWPERPELPITVATKSSNERVITELYMAAFCRNPSPSELTALMAHVSKSVSRREGLEDVYWAVMNSKEFLFQH